MGSLRHRRSSWSWQLSLRTLKCSMSSRGHTFGHTPVEQHQRTTASAPSWCRPAAIRIFASVRAFRSVYEMFASDADCELDPPVYPHFDLYPSPAAEGSIQKVTVKEVNWRTPKPVRAPAVYPDISICMSDPVQCHMEPDGDLHRSRSIPLSTQCV